MFSSGKAAFRAFDFLCRLAYDARLSTIVLNCKPSGVDGAATFAPGDAAAQEWIAGCMGKRIDVTTGTASGQIRLISITVPRIALGQVLAFQPAPAIIAETPADYAVAWRMHAPQSPARAIELAHRFAQELGGKAAIGFTFPVPGPGGVSLVRHLIGADHWAIIIPKRTEAVSVDPVLVHAASIRPEPLDWLWPGVVAQRVFTMIAGKPGMGKSQIAVHAVANVSRGGTWADGSVAEIGSAILAETEDDPSRVITPRLLAAGADLSRVRLCGQIDLSTGLDGLRQHADAIPDLRLVVLSPVLTFFGSGALDEVNVRAKIKPMLQWAAERRIAVIGITHPPKGAKANDEFAGSEVFYRAARGAWSAVIDPTDENPIVKAKRRLLVAAKNSHGDDTAMFPYRIEGVTLPGGIETSRVVFAPTGQEATGRPAKGTEGAKQWLEAFLADGARDAGDIRRAYQAAGIPKTTVDRAAKDLGVSRSVQIGSTAKLWSLPG
jgi:putative DNA primase/helicase